MIYSHDTYGLGHLRRSTLIARALAGSDRVGSVLVATGSPQAGAFPLPPGCDTVKLPTVTKRPDGRYRSRSLRLPLDQVVSLRSQILIGAARSFRPDLVLVDHSPAGMGGELWPLFEEIEGWARRPAVALGLRDIVDEAERVHHEWGRVGAWTAFERVYDRIVVYGDPRVVTTAQELGLPDRHPGKVRFVGYLGRSPGGPAGVARGDPTIVVTVGGGEDGPPVLRAYAAFLASVPPPLPFRSVVVTGPFVSGRGRRDVVGRYAASGHRVEVLTFTERMVELLRGAAGVVSMAGYNTVVEVLSAGVPALLVPREAPRLEQRLRAERLSAVADVEACSAERCASTLPSFVDRVVSVGAPRSSPDVRLDGLERVRRELVGLLDGRTASDTAEGSRGVLVRG